MKKFLATMSTIIMIFLLAFSFSGCNIINNNGYLFSVMQLASDKYMVDGDEVTRFFLEINVHDCFYLSKSQQNAYYFHLISETSSYVWWSHIWYEVIGNKFAHYMNDDDSSWILKDDAIYMTFYIRYTLNALSFHPESVFTYEFRTRYASPLSEDKYKKLTDTDQNDKEFHTYMSAPFTLKI